mgnify:CR=1 FL=1
MSRDILTGIRLTVILFIVTVLIYPLVIFGIGQVAFSYQANGSLEKNQQGKIIGSALIGQPFTSSQYFWSRPSSINYSTANPQNDKNNVLKTGISGGSNLAPSNSQELLKRINADVKKLKKAGMQTTSDLVYTSGSGLDPHISIETARSQIARVAKARNLDTNKVEIMISQYTDNRFLGIFGEPGVNVLKLNLALDALK